MALADEDYEEDEAGPEAPFDPLSDEDYERVTKKPYRTFKDEVRANQYKAARDAGATHEEAMAAAQGKSPKSDESRSPGTRVGRIRSGVTRVGNDAQSAATSGTSTLRRLAQGKAPKSLSGLLVGMILYANGMCYLRYAWAGVKGWWDAKFFNKAFTPPAGTTADIIAMPTLDTSTSVTPPGQVLA